MTLSIFDRNKVLRNRFWPRGIQCKLWHDPRPYDNQNNDDEENYDSIGQPIDSIDNDSELTGDARVALT